MRSLPDPDPMMSAFRNLPAPLPREITVKFHKLALDVPGRDKDSG